MSVRDIKKLTLITSTVLDDSKVVIQTGDIVKDNIAYSEKLSQPKTAAAGNQKTTGVILQSSLILLDQVPEGVKDRLISGLALRPAKESDEYITLLEHKCLVAGESSHIDPDFVVPEICTTVYETYLEDEESSYLIPNRVCDIIMIGNNCGMVVGSPTSELNYVDAKKGPKDKPRTLKKKFSEPVPATNKLGDVVGEKAVEGSPPKVSKKAALGNLLKENPEIRESEILIVGDSIAAGMTISASRGKIIKYADCSSKDKYFRCKTQIALSGATTMQILQRLKTFFDERLGGAYAKKKIMIISAGTNDALGNSGWGKHATGGYGKNRNLSLTAKLAIKNIDKIVLLAKTHGYEVKVMSINAIYQGKTTEKINTKNDFNDKEKSKNYNNFIKKVNEHISSKYSTFNFRSGGEQVEMLDNIHPSTVGSGQLLSNAMS